MKRKPLPKFKGPVDVGLLCERVMQDLLSHVDEKGLRLHVPKLRDHVMEHEGLHFHFSPDLIIGLKGTSRFEFIQEHFAVEAGHLAVIPGGIPHREIVLAGKGESFENLVISVYNETVSVQLQFCTGGEALETVAEYYDTTKYRQLAQYLEEIAELHHAGETKVPLGIKGLLLIYLNTLDLAIKRVRHSSPVEKLKISQTKRLIQEQLGNSSLGVGMLARALHCSSDYLSNLFHRETGQKLSTHINVERTRVAMNMLRTTPLTISEVAFATGFESQGYFSRVFKQIALKTPLAYRRSIEHSVVELEGRPRTIYAPSPDQ